MKNHKQAFELNFGSNFLPKLLGVSRQHQSYYNAFNL
jgi:hypothetical protein